MKKELYFSEPVTIIYEHFIALKKAFDLSKDHSKIFEDEMHKLITDIEEQLNNKYGEEWDVQKDRGFINISHRTKPWILDKKKKSEVIHIGIWFGQCMNPLFDYFKEKYADPSIGLVFPEKKRDESYSKKEEAMSKEIQRRIIGDKHKEPDWYPGSNLKDDGGWCFWKEIPLFSEEDPLLPHKVDHLVAQIIDTVDTVIKKKDQIDSVIEV
jgi:hypothetical protein